MQPVLNNFKQIFKIDPNNKQESKVAPNNIRPRFKRFSLFEEDEEENMHTALNYYEEVIRIDPDQANAYDSKGLTFYNEKSYEEALECYEEALKYYNDAIRINPTIAIYYTNKGNALKELGRKEEAIDCYKEAIKIDPKQDKACNGIGNIFYDEKIYEEAINCYKDAIRINPLSIYSKNKKKALKALGKKEGKCGIF